MPHMITTLEGLLDGFAGEKAESTLRYLEARSQLSCGAVCKKAWKESALAQPLRSDSLTGVAELEVGLRNDNTEIRRLRQEGALKLRLPDRATPDSLEAILVNTSGGLLSGDEIALAAHAGASASMTITSQACERVYRSTGDTTRNQIHLTCGENARLFWLPQETIIFDRARYHRQIEVDLSSQSHFVCLEALIWGRKDMGETVSDCDVRDEWRIRLEGRLVHAENFHLTGDAATRLGRQAIAGGGQSLATLLVIGSEAETLASRCRTCLAEFADIASGVSFWPLEETGKLLIRVIAADAYDLRKVLKKLVAIIGPECNPPRIWEN